MKKLIALFLTVALLASLAGCAGTTVVVGNCTCPPDAHASDSATAPVLADSALKTGLALVTGIGESVSATAEAAGEANYDLTAVAVLVDENGIIRDCVIDSLGETVAFGTDGVITSDLAAEILTKNEKGDNYNMKLYGNAKYEWYEQAAALADYAKGKTVQQLKGIVVAETGRASDVDLLAVATIKIGGYVDAIEVAVANAQHLGAQSGDALKLAVTASLESSTGASAEPAGNAQLDCTAAAVTFKDGVITSCSIDAVQAKVGFDTTGTITTELTAPLTKNQLGDGYNMKLYGKAQFEWYEQAANFAKYVTGKTAEEVAGIAVSADTKPEEGTDLIASVTIKIGDFMELIAKAAN